MDQVQILARGLLAMEAINQHADRAGIIEPPDSDSCKQCIQVGKAVERGEPVERANELLCADMKRWRAELLAGLELAREVARR